MCDMVTLTVDSILSNKKGTPMNEHFIENIEIKNFKCFEDFKAEGFGRVNLIGGKNNVGKTAFMEACFINSGSFDLKKFVGHMQSIKFMRENINILLNSTSSDTKKFIELLNNLDIETNINNTLFKIKEENGIREYIFEFNSQQIVVNINEFSYTFEYRENNNFIDSFGLSYGNIITAYSYIQKQDKEDYLNTVLKKFDKRIESFKIIDEKPQCKIEGVYIELTEFGDGVRHIVSIVTTLYKSENGYLYIDELDNGIHYTMLDELWQIVLEVSKKLNVQVFATTHSKECIESYARVAKKLEDEEIGFIELGRNKDNELDSVVMDSEMFQRFIKMGNEVRGW